ncbi:MAG: glycan-binding surface protein [Candidatus Cryptobacteroides sp.]
MKKINKIFAALAVASGFLAISCEDQPDAFRPTDGVPVLHYIRPVDVNSADSLLTEAYMESQLCFVGENLRSIHEVWFNDQQAVLNTSFMTDNTLILSVPKNIPSLVSDKIYMITSAKDTVTADFHVLVPGPSISSMSCEYALAGSEAVLYGDYFVDDPNVRLTLSLGGVQVPQSDIKIAKTSLTFVVPDAPEGPVEVSTIYGTAESVFHYKDTRGIITDFDGTTDVVPQGWNISASYSSEGGISGDYVVLGPADLDESGAWQEALKLPFWCGNWNGDPMSITSGAGIPICNFIDFSDFKNMAFKFELNIPASNPWSAGSMQIIFTSAEICANDSWQNNSYILAANGLCRALYTPWAETGSFDTGGEWITVTIPFTDFKYNADGTEGLVPLQSPKDFASLVMWPWDGGATGTACTPIFKYDNLRAVPNR